MIDEKTFDKFVELVESGRISKTEVFEHVFVDFQQFVYETVAEAEKES